MLKRNVDVAGVGVELMRNHRAEQASVLGADRLRLMAGKILLNIIPTLSTALVISRTKDGSRKTSRPVSHSMREKTPFDWPG